MAFWIAKTEPDVYSIDDLARDRRTVWDGVRNYQARNYLRQMRPGDFVFVYHSNAEPPGLAGLAEVVTAEVPDPTQFDPASRYYDPKSRPEAPRWWTVELVFRERWPLVPLTELRALLPPDHPLVRRGNRLSVMPLDEASATRLLGRARRGA